MTYQPLARKYRPSRFNELVGQEATARALSNAIKMGREAHALIFTGVRGVGKTTVARLYAKSLNCEQLTADNEPCNQCESCKAISLGCHEDVMEIDGASNTGVGDVRALQETVEYVPQRSKFKVYIIDEVHMLSQAAFNALLKTLEEPPSHVVFVFATTELHKVPQTILSRCQAFYLKKLPTALIYKRLTEIFQSEGLAFDEKAVAVIAREGHGSMRDALTLADQAIALGQGNVTADVLSGIISNLSSSPYLELLEAMIQRDFEKVAASIAELDQSGVEFIKLVESVAAFSRHAFVVQGLGIKGVDTALLGLDDVEVSRLEKIAQTAETLDLNRIFRTLVKCREDLDGSALDRFIVENYLFEWCFDPGLPSVEDLLSGRTLDAQRSSGPSTARPVQSAAPANAPKMNAGSMRELIAEMRQKQQSGEPPQKKTELTEPAAAPAKPQPQMQRPVQENSPPPMTQRSAQRIEGATSQPAPVEQPVEQSSGGFPETWRQLIDTWKREKPLQARKLEEVHALTYSPEEITLAVPEEGLAGRQLLQKEEQNKIAQLFRELFSFKGVLTFIPKSKAIENAMSQVTDSQPEQVTDQQPAETVVKAPIVETQPTEEVPPPVTLEGAVASTDGEELLPETVRTEKMREAEIARQKKIQESKDAPFTQDLARALGASIEQVRLAGYD